MFLMLTAFQAVSATVSDVRLSMFSSGVARLVVESNDRVNPKVFGLENPERFVVDIPDSAMTSSLQKKYMKGNSVVTKVRFGKPKPGTSRIVLDLTSPVRESHFILPPDSKQKVWRFVLDLTPTKERSASYSQTVSSSQNSLKKPTSERLLPFASRKKSKKIIMLDAGHGGKDPGAISRSGKYEKHLTLKMARETRELLQKAGYKVVMTRDSDVYITLRGRVQKAHDAKADLFISIHADSARNRSAKGLSIYTISEKASDKEAAALAERENKSDILFGMDLGDYQQEVSNVLIDLAKQDTMKESRKYADLVVKEMKRNVQLIPNAHRFAGFAVLKSANIPSVLLEMGYLSNKQEDRLLQQASYRKKLAKALVKAVNLYFKDSE